MNLDEIAAKAQARVESQNPGCSKVNCLGVYEHVLDGTLADVTYDQSDGRPGYCYVWFGKGDIRSYRTASDIISAVSSYKESRWFFRFIEMAGIGGVIAFALVLIFSVFLCVLAFIPRQVDQTILEVVKLSFTIILGYFFGSQSSGKRDA